MELIGGYLIRKMNLGIADLGMKLTSEWEAMFITKGIKEIRTLTLKFFGVELGEMIKGNLRTLQKRTL